MSDYNLLNPAPILRLARHAKREWRIATYGSGHSASPIKGTAYSADALRRTVGGKIGAG